MFKYNQIFTLFFFTVCICLVLFSTTQIIQHQIEMSRMKADLFEKSVNTKLSLLPKILQKLENVSNRGVISATGESKQREKQSEEDNGQIFGRKIGKRVKENEQNGEEKRAEGNKGVKDPFSKWVRRNKPINESPSYCVHVPSKKISKENPRFKLVSSFYVRIYGNDLSELSREDLLQFLTFLKYAGVEHVYIHDNWLKEDEKIFSFLQENARLGQEDSFVTWNDWHDVSAAYHEKKKSSPGIVPVYEVEVPAKRDVQKKYSSEFEWWLDMDIDEYVFFKNDMREGFLRRFVEKAERENPNVAQFMFENLLVVGYRNRTRSPIFLQQLNHIFNSPPNPLVKTLCYGPKVNGPGMHSYSVNGATHRVPIHEGKSSNTFHLFFWVINLSFLKRICFTCGEPDFRTSSVKCPLIL